MLTPFSINSFTKSTLSRTSASSIDCSREPTWPYINKAYRSRTHSTQAHNKTDIGAQQLIDFMNFNLFEMQLPCLIRVRGTQKFFSSPRAINKVSLYLYLNELQALRGMKFVWVEDIAYRPLLSVNEDLAPSNVNSVPGQSQAQLIWSWCIGPWKDKQDGT